MGAVILVAYGSLWLSTRGQHPYKGPVAALPDGDSLSFTRLQDMLDLTPGNLITHLRKLEDAGYLTSETTGNGRASRTTITLTRQGRAALGTYTATLRDILAGL